MSSHIRSLLTNPSYRVLLAMVSSTRQLARYIPLTAALSDSAIQDHILLTGLSRLGE